MNLDLRLLKNMCCFFRIVQFRISRRVHYNHCVGGQHLSLILFHHLIYTPFVFAFLPLSYAQSLHSVLWLPQEVAEIEM